MKKNLFLSFILLCVSFSAYCQNSISVLITGECSPVTGIYEFAGLLNGKNTYTRPFMIDGENLVLGVGYDNTKWVLYIDGDLIDDGFRNNNVPDGLLPPFTGWEASGCNEGTMIIEEIVSSNKEFQPSTGMVKTFPNPSSNYILIQSDDNNSENFRFNIIDMTGRNVQNGISKFNEQIFIEGLTNGVYLIQLETENGTKITEKLIKS